MMETKLWTVLCALLLVLNLGSADHVGDGHAAATERAGGAEVGGREPPPAEPVPASRLGHNSHAAPALNGSDTNRSSNGTSSLSSNTTKVGETISQMNEPTKENETSVVLPPVSVVPQTTVNPTEASEPRILPPESHDTTSHIPPATTTSVTSPPHTAQNAPADTPTTNTSNHSAPLPPHSTSTSQQPTHPNIHASTSAPTAKPETTTTTSTQSSSTSSTSSSQEPHSSVSQTLTSPHTSQSEGPRDLPKSTVTPPSNISAQSKAHADSPSQLNVGGDTTMVHESPTLDPLLAGLVSAFIITAVIITLLLFLKLRRRDSRPEFRRLQDLPMDDMMEDTPLSMYSY